LQSGAEAGRAAAAGGTASGSGPCGGRVADRRRARQHHAADFALDIVRELQAHRARKRAIAGAQALRLAFKAACPNVVAALVDKTCPQMSTVMLAFRRARDRDR
jgi:hypothetical protein